MHLKPAGGGGIYVVGRRYYLKVKWLRPHVRALRSGVWQAQVYRLLLRLSRTLPVRNGMFWP